MFHIDNNYRARRAMMLWHIGCQTRRLFSFFSSVTWNRAVPPAHHNVGSHLRLHYWPEWRRLETAVLTEWNLFSTDIVTSFGFCSLQSFRSPSGLSGVSMNGGLGGLDVLRQVEAKYPALLFKQQLTAYVEKLYGMLRDNLKKEISPLLTACIQVGALSLTLISKFQMHLHMKFY